MDESEESNNPMILVLGAIRVRSGQLDAALALSQKHVARSREEAGCIAHAVHRDTEDDLRLVFVEQWSDVEALHVHFKIPASKQFVQDLNALCSEKPTMNIYQADELPM